MKINENMRDALVALTAGYSDGGEIHQATLEALQRRGLAASPNGEWEPTPEGREVLGDEFRERREAMTEPPNWGGPYRYWTRERLGREIGVSETAVYLWESGRRPIKPITWTALRYAELRAYLRWGMPADLTAAVGGIIQGIDAAGISEEEPADA